MAPDTLLTIDPAKETARIRTHIAAVLKKTGFQKVMVAVSGGIDSATSFNLLRAVIPKEHLFAVHLYYFETSIASFDTVIAPFDLPKNNILLSSIRESVDLSVETLQLHFSGSPIKSGMTTNTRHSELDLRFGGLDSESRKSNIRRGNIMARMRMIYLYDLAKKHQALVCGTENRSEYHLGYFTRFGDAASDFEVINHLYKTQVHVLAKYLHVPQSVIDMAPSAGLWDGQTDENELGFSYKEADPVLYWYFDKHISIKQIVEKGYKKAESIIAIALQNSFKHEVPYVL